MSLTSNAALAMVPTTDAASLVESAPLHLARSAATLTRRLDAVATRTLDVVGAGLLVVLSLPVVLLAAAAIRFDGGGPILFRQVRVGRHGAPFALWKLRTMVVDAEARKDGLRPLNAHGQVLFKMVGDPRITRVGRILRATSIDELPQLWNVLRGDMSLVGPRPHLPEEVAQFPAELHRRNAVRPGLTGPWQLRGRDQFGGGVAVIAEHDLAYVDGRSAFGDVRLLGATVGHVVVRSVRHLRRSHWT